MIGTTLGHYRIVDKIGEGGMGEVYRAHDERLDRDVAVKVLPASVEQDPDRLERFEREARAVAQLDHPNILAIHDFGSEDGTVYAVMELLDGESLREVISKGGLTTGKAVEYAEAIADGLAAAHDKGIIHRDLKPENVFLTKDGRIKILDFGLAKLKLPDADMSTEMPTATLDTAPGGLLGTIPYMAPEQVQGRSADHRSDIFALGTVLYEMLAGHRPFGGATSVETAAAILKEDPEPISMVAPGVSLGLANVVSKCLEKRPEDRFNSAHDLALTLGALDATTPIPLVEDQSLIAKRWPHILSVVIAAVIGLLVILPPEALFERVSGTGDAAVVRSIAILPLENLTGDPDQQYFVDGLHEELIATFAQISGFDKVIARTSVMGFRDSETPIREIGRMLDVDAVLEGSVRRSGDTIRATLQLIRTDTEDHLWAESFDRDYSDILKMQSEVARTVAGRIRVALTPEEEKRLDETHAVDRDAYKNYLKGVHFLRSGLTELNYVKAIGFFEDAIELNPYYAEAYAGLSQALQGLTGRYRPPSEVMPSALEAALRARQLDEDLTSAHVALGMMKWDWEWNWIGAEDEFRRALELSPNDIEALGQYAVLLVYLGRHQEASSVVERALELDPVNSRALAKRGWVDFYARRYEDGIHHLLRTIEMYPQEFIAHFYLAWNYWGNKSFEEASAAMNKAEELHPNPNDDPFFVACRVFLDAETGRVDRAREGIGRLRELRQEMYVPPWLMAVAYIGVGELDRAIDWCEKGFEGHDTHMAHIRVNPVNDPLRGDPRFQAIIEKMGFPED